MRECGILRLNHPKSAPRLAPAGLAVARATDGPPMRRATQRGRDMPGIEPGTRTLSLRVTSANDPARERGSEQPTNPKRPITSRLAPPHAQGAVMSTQHSNACLRKRLHRISHENATQSRTAHPRARSVPAGTRPGKPAGDTPKSTNPCHKTWPASSPNRRLGRSGLMPLHCTSDIPIMWS